MSEEKKIEPTSVSLVFNGDVTHDEWSAKGKELKTVISVFTENVRWWFGDWIIYGESRFPGMCSQDFSETGYSDGTIRNCAYVCQRIPPERRKHNLSFEHHYQVARLEPNDQDKFLNEAEQEDWTINQLRKAVAGKFPAMRRAMSKNVEDRRSKEFEHWWSANGNAMFSVLKKDGKEAMRLAFIAGSSRVRQ